MSDGEDRRYREAAAECIKLACSTKDAGTRLSLLALAQKWQDVANLHDFRHGRFLAALQEFNDRQMKRH